MKRMEMMKEKKMVFKKLKEARNETIKANRDQMKENRSGFKTENKEEMKEVFSSLDESTQAELKELNETHKEAMSALKAEYKDMEKTEENMAALKEKMEAAKADHYNEMKNVLGDNTEALELLEKRKELYKENMELRKENAQARKDFRGERSELVGKYKTKFADRLKSNLDRISPEKLEKVSGKIDTVIEKIEAKTNMSDEKKDQIVYQLIALKELVDEQLDQNEIENEDDVISEVLGEME
jgi:hypothetical protein